MRVGIDVGNTAIKVALEHDPEVLVLRVAAPTTTETIARHLAELAAADGIVDVRIASVNRGAACELIQRTAAIAGQQVQFRRITRNDLPITVATDQPDRVGIDRIVGAYGAARSYQVPLAIVDAGTTVTVDLVDDAGVYCGGAIIPGLEMQTAALNAGTDALPRIDWAAPCSGLTSVIGKNTLAAIQLGILSSIVGGVERLVRSYGSPTCVVVTGGDSECIFKLLAATTPRDFAVHHHAHLVCRTLACDV